MMTRRFSTSAAAWLGLCVIACTPRDTVQSPRGDSDKTMDDGAYVAYRVERERLRDEHASPPELMELLGLRPGMTVVDIGAGSGHLAVRMARQLQGSGQVYATDIDPRMVRTIEEQARTHHLANLHAVLVSPDGLDPFYGTRRFDRIVMTNVRLAREVIVDYYRGLRASLAPGGRLVIRYATGHPRFPDLSREDFVDLPAFITALSQQPPTSPFVQALGPATRERVGAFTGAAADTSLVRAVIAELNAAIGDPSFGRGFVRDGRFLDPRFASPLETQYANFLLTAVTYWGIHDETRPRVGHFAFDNYARRLNNRLFVRQFGAFLLDGWSDPYWEGKANSEAVERKDIARAAIERAGWSPTMERMIPYHFVWVFE